MASSASIKSSLSAASKGTSISISRGSSSASSALSSASAKASAAAADGFNRAADAASTQWSALTVAAIVITVLAIAVAGLYFSGQADELFVYLAKTYFKAEAKAEEKALEKAETEKAESFLKGRSTCSRAALIRSPHLGSRGMLMLIRACLDRLKKNPMMGESELNQIQSGLGGEAVREGLGGVSSKLGGLGKL